MILATLVAALFPKSVLAQAGDAGSPGDQVRVLEVPYASQGKTNWCFITSLSMVLRYYGKPAETLEIAADLGDGPQRSVNIADIFFGEIAGYLSQWPGLSTEYRWGVWGFRDYTAAIDSGAPVIVSSFGLPFTRPGHSVVVIGYKIIDGEEYVYVHDPSGYLTNLRWKGHTASYACVSWQTFREYSGLAWSHVVVSATVS